jgi:hypothetical protein
MFARRLHHRQHPSKALASLTALAAPIHSDGPDAPRPKRKTAEPKHPAVLRGELYCRIGLGACSATGSGMCLTDCVFAPYRQLGDWLSTPQAYKAGPRNDRLLDSFVDITSFQKARGASALQTPRTSTSLGRSRFIAEPLCTGCGERPGARKQTALASAPRE